MYETDCTQLSVSLESSELEHQLYEIGHAPQVGLFSYAHPKTVHIETDGIVIRQGNVRSHRGGVDEVRLELTTHGVVIIDVNVTGRAVNDNSAHLSHIFAILEDDVISGIKRCAAFARNLFDVKDPYKRYDRLCYNAVLNGIGYRTLMKVPSSTGTYSVGLRNHEIVIAFDQPRPITRADLAAFDGQANASLVMFRRRMRRS